jgi:hypothetical protein
LQIAENNVTRATISINSTSWGCLNNIFKRKERPLFANARSMKML